MESLKLWTFHLNRDDYKVRKLTFMLLRKLIKRQSGGSIENYQKGRFDETCPAKLREEKY